MEGEQGDDPCLLLPIFLFVIFGEGWYVIVGR